MKQSPAPVLLVIRHMNMGGAQRQLALLARGLDRTRFTPIVACLRREEPLLEALRDEGIETCLIPARASLDPGLPVRLAAAARRRGVRIVHSYLFAANAWGRLAARLAGVGVVVASERTDRPRRRRREIWTERVLARWTSAYVVNSRAVGRRLASQVPAVADRIVCIHNGIDLAPFQADRRAERARVRETIGAGPDSVLAVVVGNLTPEKGHGTLLEAIAADGLSARLHLVLCGEGPERPAIEARARQLGVADRVHLLGMRDDVPRVLRGADLLVQASTREGMPNAVLEGMAAGLPVVATDVGGTAEALDDGACGMLVPSGSPAALRAAVGELLADPARRDRLGDLAARRIAADFTVEGMVRRTEELYSRLLAAHASRSAG